MRRIMFISMFALSACADQPIGTSIEVNVLSVDQSGMATFEVANSTEFDLCTSNAGLGTMQGTTPITFVGEGEIPAEIIYDFWGDEPALEPFRVASGATENFTLDLQSSHSIKIGQELSASVTVALWKCQTDVPLWTTLEHELTWGPNYLADQGVMFIESEPVSFIVRLPKPPT